MVHDAHLAEDVTQCVFLALARDARKLSGRPVLAGWLHRTAQNLAANTIRSQARRQTREREAASMNELHEPDDVWEHIAPHLDAALGDLKDADREALFQRYFQRQSAREMAQNLGLSSEAAQKRVSRAIERLRESLTKRGVTIGASGLVLVLCANSVQAAPAGLAISLAATAAKVPAAAAKTWSLKGVLKLMAFTKAKAALATGVGVLLISGAALVQDPHPASPGTKLKLPVGQSTPAISMGGWHGFILASDGSLWCWGENYLGWPVLGLGDIKTQPLLCRIDPDKDWIGIASSFSHALALKSDGTLWAWGENLHGQLGKGPAYSAGKSRRYAKQAFPEPSAPGTDWKQVAAGGTHSVALKRDGTLWAWGNNWAGQLGIGSTNKEVHEITQIGAGTNWTKIWAAGLQNVAQQSDGSLWFWGSLTGKAEDTNRFFIPTRVSADTDWVNVSFGYFVVFAIKADGTLWVWGRNAGIYSGAPIQLVNFTPARVGTNNDWEACSSSEYFYHLLKKKDGSLWSLDASDYASANKASYTPVELNPIDLKKDVAAFGNAGRGTMGVVLTRDGEVWTWGKVLGEYAPAQTNLQAIAKSLGLKTGRPERQPIIRDKPWQLPHLE